MDTNQIVYLVLGLLVVAAFVWRTWLQHKAATQWDAREVYDDFRQAVELVEKLAPAADQLVAIGQLIKGQRSAYVIEMAQKVLPNLDPKIIQAILEWWVATRKDNDTPATPVAPVA